MFCTQFQRDANLTGKGDTVVASRDNQFWGFIDIALGFNGVNL